MAAWARQNHLTVVGTVNGVVTVSGSRAQIASTFGSATAPQVPTALTGVATGAGSDVSPLRMQPLGLHNRPMTGLTSTPACSSGPTCWPGGYGAAKLRAAYGVSGTGSGLTVATVQFDGWNSADLTDYATAAGLTLAPGQLTSISVDGAAVSGSDQEDSLDAETLLAMAPAAKQLMYIAPNTTTGLIDVYAQIANHVASDHIAAVSISWGFCEANWAGSASLRSSLESSLNAIVAAGATLFAASGDDGPYDCRDGVTLSTDWPAVSPNVVGVGGTHLTGTGPYAETAWEDPNATSCVGAGGPSGGGGGTSTSVSRPSWQTNTGIGGSFRLVPDISAEADPCVGPTVLLNGSWYNGGGTSLAAPIVTGGLISELSNSSRTTGIGDIHSTLYNAPSATFRDVTSGAFAPYSAGVGFDELTGRGSPQLDALFVPGAPTNVVADPGNTALSVSWSPASDFGSPITDYTATASPGGATCHWSAGPLGCILTGLTNGTSYTVTVSATNAAGTGPASSASAAVKPALGDAFHSLTPARILDSRPGAGNVGGYTSPWGSGVTRNVSVGGAGGVPANADAVVLNVTETGATGSSYLSLWPAGAARPTVSSLNFTAGETIPNQVTVKLGAGGQVSVFNASGNADVIVDVTGYYDIVGR